MNNVTIPLFTSNEEKEVLERLQPENSKACNNNLLWGNAQGQNYAGEFHGFSFKRSNLSKANFTNAKFDHCNFTGSILHQVSFNQSCTFSSVNFMRSIITDSCFSSKEILHALNFSSSTLENVEFKDLTLRGSFFNNAKLINCTFENSKIMSTSFDNCLICNTSFSNCNMRNLNLEFSTFQNVDLDRTQISFYQLPYIIGIFKNIENLKTLIIGCGKNRSISIDEYIQQAHDSIVYFTSKQQYLPLANLYYLLGKKDIAANCIRVGIENAIIKNDYALIKYLIKLSLNLSLLCYSDINSIMKEIDLHLSNIKEDINYSYYLMQSYEIQKDVHDIFGKSILSLKIDTRFSSSEFKQASGLCQELDNILSSSNKDLTYSFNLSHNSPISILLTVIGAAADLIGIASFIYQLIEKKLAKRKSVDPKTKELFERNNKLFLANVDNNITSLKKILQRTAKAKQDEIIEDFRLKLLSSIGEMIDINLSLVTTLDNT